MKKFIPFVLMLVVISTACKKKSEKLSYADLVGRLTDLQYLALLPDTGTKTSLISTYDRRSRFDKVSGKYIDWPANADGDFDTLHMKKEGKGFVIAEIEGPGCIWRIWSARPEKGHLKMYLDRNDSATIDLSYINYFDRKVSPFNYPELVYTAARGCNNYVPISFQKSCKIVAEPGWGAFYHFNYMTFPKGTKIETFKMNPDEKTLVALQKANDMFAKKGEYPYPENTSDKILKAEINLKAGEKTTISDIKGEYAIKSIRIKTKFKDQAEAARALRRTAIQIHWDDEAEPAVWSPLGDFFGTTPGINLYKTFPLGMTEDGLYCYWYMPFEKHALIEILNEDSVNYNISYEVKYGKLDYPIAKYGRFHAKWHRDVFPVDSSRWPDWTLLVTEGKGRYVGTMLNVWNPKGSTNSPKLFKWKGHYWWGEGDEKFFVDNEKFPSTFGTGSEDYFGYAWGEPTLFQQAFHAQSFTSGNRGYQTIARWHITDNLPFQKSFEGCIEKYYPNETPTQYASVVFWYLSPDGKDLLKPVPVKERYKYDTPYNVSYFKAEGAIEAEDFQILNKADNIFQVIYGDDFGMKNLSNGKLLNWIRKSEAQDNITINADIVKDANYRLEAGLIKWSDHGIVQFIVDDKNIGKPVNLYAAEGKGAKLDYKIGNLSLKKGIHKITIKMVGANPSVIAFLSKQHYYPSCAIDYIRFVPGK